MNGVNWGRVLGTVVLWFLLGIPLELLDRLTVISDARLGHASGWFGAFLVLYRHPGLISARRVDH